MSSPAFALFFTGLPASGKSTLAGRVASRFERLGVEVRVLDSDELRSILTPEPTYTSDERDWFYRVLGFIAGMLTEHGVAVLIAASAPLPQHRDATQERVARFGQVFVDCPESVCRGRDPKGLWAKSDAGEIDSLPGAGVPYHPPESPLIHVNTHELDPGAAARKVEQSLVARGWVSRLAEPDS